VAIVSASGEDLVYIREGIQRLALVLRAFAKLKGWSDREFAKEAGVNHGTANRYMNAQPVRAKKETIQAFAKIMYRVVKINGDRVFFDDENIYGEDWVSLARIATINPGVEVS
jgi:transcriptional regulator with XRE-family HTH domain